MALCDRDPAACLDRCHGGDASSCENIARLYSLQIFSYMFLGDSKKRRTADYYERACQLGSVRGCWLFGLLVVTRGENVRPGPEHLAQAHRNILFSRIASTLSCSLNDAAACFNLAAHHGRDPGLPKSLRLNFEFLQKSCDLGFSDACDIVADRLKAIASKRSDYHKLHAGEPWLVELETRATEENILALYEVACQAKTSTACSSLAHHYCMQSREKKHLRDKCAHYRELTCQHGPFRKCLDLATDYIDPWNCKIGPLPCRPERGRFLLDLYMPKLEVLCEQGFMGACRHLAVDLEYPAKIDHTPQDLAKAEYYYQKVCDADPVDFKDYCRDAATIRERIAKGEK